MLEAEATSAQAWWALQGIKHSNNSLINRINATLFEKNKKKWGVDKPMHTNEDIRDILAIHGMSKKNTRDMHLIFIEGIPGSGKSTLAEKSCVAAVRAGYDAKWYLEESKNHPVHPATLRILKSQPTFIEDCLRSWSSFVEQYQKGNILHILEGSAFQSTVRFMMEHKQAGIEDYFRRFEDIVRPLSPRMVYLRPRDAAQYAAYVSRLRGPAWTAKVGGYLARTHYSVSRGLSGAQGMHQFWAEYAALCDDLIARTSMPVKTIEVVPDEWDRHLTEAIGFLGLSEAN